MPELPEVETVRLGLAPVMEGAVIDKVDAPPARPPLAVSAALRAAAHRPADRRARPAGEIPPRRPRRRQRPGHASRHVGIVPDRGGGRARDRRALLPSAEHAPRPRPCRLRPVLGRARRLQRSPPLRHDGPRAARTGSKSRAFQGDGDRAARQRAERRDDRGAVQGPRRRRSRRCSSTRG